MHASSSITWLTTDLILPLRCKKKVPARKQLTIFRAPFVLTVLLKRFSFMHSHGGKISKHVEFPAVLDLHDFMSTTARPSKTSTHNNSGGNGSNKGGDQRPHSQAANGHAKGPLPAAPASVPGSAAAAAAERYRLYAVLVHHGSSLSSGHYVCFVRTSGGTWYLMNDSQVCVWIMYHTHVSGRTC